MLFALQQSNGMSIQYNVIRYTAEEACCIQQCNERREHSWFLQTLLVCFFDIRKQTAAHAGDVPTANGKASSFL